MQDATIIPGSDLAALRARLQALMPGLRRSDAAVVELVVRDPAAVMTATTAELAERVGVSTATVVRASRAAGYEGFRGLKDAVLLAAGVLPSWRPPTRLAETTSIAELRDALLDSHVATLAGISATLDAEAVAAAVGRLAAASRVLVVGSGTSAAVAVDAAFRLSAVGLLVQNPADHLSASVVAALLGPGDVVLAVSMSGRTPQTLQLVDTAQGAGAGCVAITSAQTSPLAEAAEVLLVAGGLDPGLQLASASSRLAHLAVVDVLHAGLALAAGRG